MNTILTKSVFAIKQSVVEMAKRVVQQHLRAYNALNSIDKDVLNSIINDDQKLDNEYLEIKKQINFELTKEPLGRYLRRCVSYFIIVKELERIGDYAKQICRFLLIYIEPANTSIDRIKRLYTDVMQNMNMLSEIILSEDIEKINQTAAYDVHINKMTDEIIEELIRSFTNSKHTQSENAERVHLLKLIQNLERAGDHVVNICEELRYVVTGKYK
ncbi:hypothetical protein E1I18_01030 [Mycoplasmopsis mucosicanis]|uniref:PhoU domain-containing protein n=1 Tax=Mycoplasmopsis mucosicanis TaxID=458208 RepID=A0A507SUX6_9BACT|nr:PhoU domain-containing protein [Mycoplasmopsis mucosicanis]TQC54025.1 hypothetical protein E1I18_01030 [Mycoplasmopsis mucosicanis]